MEGMGEGQIRQAFKKLNTSLINFRMGEIRIKLDSLFEITRLQLRVTRNIIGFQPNEVFKTSW